MKELKIKDVLDKIKGKLICGNEEEVIENLFINTREPIDNGIFVGIKGENVNGSKFYKDALDNGAKGCIINEIDGIEEYDDKFIITVPNTVIAIQELARIKRDLYNIPVIGVTGSVGKTSTKDYIYSVLGTKYKVIKTEGNYNNEIGMPLTLLRLKDEEAIVLEMGMSNLKEISLLSEIARPTLGVITNVGTAHIGILGSRENILKAKLEIRDGLEGELIINNDNDMLHAWNEENKEDNVITIGVDNESDFMARNIKIENDNEISFEYADEKYTLKTTKEIYVYNALFGIVIGKKLGLGYEDIKKGLLKCEFTSGRNEIIETNGYTVINDCYNASYESIKEALKSISNRENRTIAVLGDVLELGEFSEEMHKKIGREVVNYKPDILVSIGKEAKYIYDTAKDEVESKYFENNEEAIKYLKEIVKPKDVILIKASNGMNFKEIVNSLK